MRYGELEIHTIGYLNRNIVSNLIPRLINSHSQIGVTKETGGSLLDKSLVTVVDQILFSLSLTAKGAANFLAVDKSRLFSTG